MAHRPPPQQPIPAPQPPNQHHPKIEHPRPTPRQQFPRILRLISPPQAEISPSPSHQQNGTSPRVISASNRLLPAPPSHQSHRIYNAYAYANGKYIGLCMSCTYYHARPRFMLRHYVVFTSEWRGLIQYNYHTTNPRNITYYHKVIMIDVWRCRVLYMCTQSTRLVPHRLLENQPTISLSEVLRMKCLRPKIDRFADDKVWTDNWGVDAATISQNMKRENK